MFEGINCLSGCGMCDGSICDHLERAIRCYANGEEQLRPMTNEEREWCIDEADRAGEGMYNADELANTNDMALAKCVIIAWNEYVRSMY